MASGGEADVCVRQMYDVWWAGGEGTTGERWIDWAGRKWERRALLTWPGNGHYTDTFPHPLTQPLETTKPKTPCPLSSSPAGCRRLVLCQCVTVIIYTGCLCVGARAACVATGALAMAAG